MTKPLYHGDHLKESFRVEVTSKMEDGTTPIIGTMTITNNGTGTETQGNYNYWIRASNHKLIRMGDIAGFPRKRLLIWDLISRIMAIEFRWRNKIPKIRKPKSE